MNQFILFLIIPFLFIPYSVYGLNDLENTEIIAESVDFHSDFVLKLQFGENQFKYGKMIPTVDSGSLHLFGDFIELTNVRAKMMGNSFVVKSDELLVYAKGLEDSEYKINAYLITAQGFTKYELKPTLVNSFTSEKEQEIKTDLHILIEQDSRIYQDDTYSIEIKAFDKTINSEPDFDDESGHLNDVNIKVVLTHEEDPKETFALTGKTDDLGYWNGLLYFPERDVLFGSYLIDVTANYLGQTATYDDKMFLINALNYGKGNIADGSYFKKGKTIPPSPIIDSETNWDLYQNRIKLDATHLYDPIGSYKGYLWIQVDENGKPLPENHPDYTGITTTPIYQSSALIAKPHESKHLYYQLTFTTSRDSQIVMYEVIFIK